MPLDRSEATDPYFHQNIEEQSREEGSKLNISPVQPSEVQPHDAHWLRMDPSLTRSVLAKTEEELLGSLAALMRNKVEHEQVSRRFAQVQIDCEQARRELETIRGQIRRAEEEVATRLNEQTRVNEEIDRVRQELAVLRDGHQQHSEIVASLKNEAAQTQQSLDEANRHLLGVKETTRTQLAQHQETLVELTRVKNEKAILEETLAPLQAEVDERIKAREVLIAEAMQLHQLLTDLATDREQRAAEVSELTTSHAELQDKVDGLRTAHGSLVSEIDYLRQHAAQHAADKEQLKGGLSELHHAIAATVAEREHLQEILTEEQAQVADLLARKGSLEQVVAEAVVRQRALLTEIAALEARSQELAEAAEKAEQARIAEGLPLLFEPEAHRVASEWDSYPLESEFHTDEVLDAKMVAKLVSMLPGLEGCLIVKNHGPVLASQMPERIHAHLKAPDRNYHLLFDRLEKKVEEHHLEHVRLATFDLGTEALTIAQSNHAFVFVNHRQTRLRPGMPGKLAAIVSEISKMYP